MEGLLQALIILCGLDYTGEDYTQCKIKTAECYNRQIQTKLGENLDRRPTSSVFYKCYDEGTNKNQKGE